MLQHLNLPSNLIGLTDKEVAAARTIHGLNRQQEKSRRTSWHILLSILKEPMLILLVAISVLYFILGQNGEAWFMIAAIFIVFGISFYQDNRSEKALKALETLAAPLSHVIRNGISLEIPTEEIVPGDLVIADEGSTINADGRIVYSHDFSINESILTGESASQYKSASTEDNTVYSGTLVASGLAVFKVEKTGLQTKIGQLGTSLAEIKEEQTPLQKQIETFVRRMAISGAIIFLLVWVINYMKSGDILASLLKGLTLAMSILPEEIPVAFTTFMALGSWRLMRSGIIVKKTSTVETLGNATIICADKTGTITENNMTLHGVYALASHHYYENGQYDAAALDVIETAMWASEPVPFDPMEKTLHTVYREHTRIDHRPAFRMIHEYPLGGVPPRMTHIFENESKQRIIACKGAPEAFLNNNLFSNEELQRLHSIISELAAKGFRVLGVASASSSPQPFPKNQEDFNFQLKGFVAFYDPPKKGIEKVFEQFYTAGLKVKIISGDNRMTTTAIAKSAGIKNPGQAINGEELMLLPKEQFHDAVRNNTIFTRMYPEAKLATVESLKAQKEIVAMVGDGVNDGPALKSAHIGIAMGQKGTEIAKAAAALVLVQDDLSKMVDALATGRRIYSNLKKAIQYIVSIHIPIILTVSLPLFFGWIYPDIFTPVHVIFLELVMGPTCSIVYENEPMEAYTMRRPPRPVTSTFLNWKEMSISIIQGLIITMGVLGVYQYAVMQGADEIKTRSMVFTTLVLSNIFLTLVNRSFYHSFLTSMRMKNNLMAGILVTTVCLLLVSLYFTPVATFFDMTAMHAAEFGICTGVAILSVFWFEGLKWVRRRN